MLSPRSSSCYYCASWSFFFSTFSFVIPNFPPHDCSHPSSCSSCCFFYFSLCFLLHHTRHHKGNKRRGRKCPLLAAPPPGESIEWVNERSFPGGEMFLVLSCPSLFFIVYHSDTFSPLSFSFWSFSSSLLRLRSYSLSSFSCSSCFSVSADSLPRASASVSPLASLLRCTLCLFLSFPLLLLFLALLLLRVLFVCLHRRYEDYSTLQGWARWMTVTT